MSESFIDQYPLFVVSALVVMTIFWFVYVFHFKKLQKKIRKKYGDKKRKEAESKINSIFLKYLFIAIFILFLLLLSCYFYYFGDNIGTAIINKVDEKKQNLTQKRENTKMSSRVYTPNVPVHVNGNSNNINDINDNDFFMSNSNNYEINKIFDDQIDEEIPEAYGDFKI